MVRVCCIHGTWQLVTIVAGLRQAAKTEPGEHEDYLVFYGAEKPPAWVEFVQSIASKLWPWKNIIWTGDLLVQRPAGDVHPLLNQIRERCGITKADQVWIWTLHGQSQKLMVEAFPDAKIVLYEDGLHTYVMQRPKLSQHLPLVKKAKEAALLARRRFVDGHNLRRRILMYYPFQQHLKRVQNSYYYLAKDLKLQEPYASLPRTLIADDVLEAVLRDFAAACNVQNNESAAASNGEKRALVIGQCFAKIDAMTEDQEMDLYRKLVERLTGKGYTVYWKDHPRVEGLYYQRLRELFPPEKIRQVDLDPKLPIELAAGQLGVSLCIGAISSSLFYLQRLYNIEGYTLAREVLPFVKGDMVRVANLTIDNIPSYEALLD